MSEVTILEPKKYIGEYVVYSVTKETGVVTRFYTEYEKELEKEIGVIYVLFPKNIELALPFPEAFEKGILVLDSKEEK